MKKNLTKNIPLKIMSIIVGILVWLIVVNVDDPIITKGFVISDVQIINEAYVDQLGEMVMERLARLDEVAYVRFASVYRQFRDIETFMDELTRLLSSR